MEKPLTKKDLVRKVLSDDLKITTTLPYTIKEFKLYLFAHHRINIGCEYIWKILQDLNITWKKAAYFTDVPEAIELYFKALKPNKEGFKIYAINHIIIHVKKTTNFKPSRTTVKNTIAGLNLKNIKLFGQKKESYSKGTLNAVKDYFDTIAADENGIKTYVLNNVSTHVMQTTNTYSPHTTIENIISTLDLKNIKIIPGPLEQKTLNTKRPNKRPQYLKIITDAIMAYINQLPENEDGIKTYSTVHLLAYLKETIDPKATVETIRKILPSLGINNLKCVPINSQRYSQEIRNAITTTGCGLANCGKL